VNHAMWLFPLLTEVNGMSGLWMSYADVRVVSLGCVAGFGCPDQGNCVGYKSAQLSIRDEKCRVPQGCVQDVWRLARCICRVLY
jgi:hypothetical protein